ncbi:hypothetical protein [Prochlorococcus marinus]|uniref:hypothetical protein n=1 Tax=Prochlorococcus TaxID=1218 RepID=UPI000AA7FFB6|nr:hypothetical protein [Prochlorococcus marinus]
MSSWISLLKGLDREQCSGGLGHCCLSDSDLEPLVGLPSGNSNTDDGRNND